MFSEMKINGILLPRPDEDLIIKNRKITTEYETEAGTTQISVRRASKLTVSGAWTVTGAWMAKFREWADADTVTVSVFFPSKTEMSGHVCRLVIESERHIRYSREQLGVEGLYRIEVTMEEL